MNEHTVKAYGNELEDLSTKLMQMGGLAEEQLAAAIEALSKRDNALAEQTVAADAQIDDFEHEVEDQAVKLLALRQPMGSDLREVLAAIKICSDIERVGDLAKNLAKRALVLNQETPVPLTQGLSRMGLIGLRLLKDVLDAYIKKDAALALAVWRSDEDLDELYNSLFRELLTYMMEDPRTISSCTHLLFIAKNLERIGDHATNIAETVHFMVEGAYISDERPKGDVTSTTNVDYKKTTN